jgi:hypothetical protein
VPDATYLLPIRAASPPSAELTGYLRGVSELLPVVVVDGSCAEVFAAAHAAWSPFALHIAPDPSLACANGKVSGVLTGLRHVTAPVAVIADDDVRYDAVALRACLLALRDADLVRPQNYFDPLPWHAAWDTGRTLLNRAFGQDFPGTLLVRTDVLRRAGGYDGDVLFENLELIRTVAAAGGRCVDRPDVYVRRMPPSTRHFVGQRVRQAYDELARPARLAAELAIAPALAAVIARRRWRALAAAAALVVTIAEVGRRRHGGAHWFAWRASVIAPLWVLERAVCSWCAVVVRLRGGVRYGGRRLRRAANSERALRAAFAGAAAGQ